LRSREPPVIGKHRRGDCGIEVLCNGLGTVMVSSLRAKSHCTGIIWIRMANLELVALLVRDYDPAIRFFVDLLQFELVEDTPSLTNDGRAKRWVVVRPAGAETGILLARADGEDQVRMIGRQLAGRVGFFLRVKDFDVTYNRMMNAGVRFVSQARVEADGTCLVRDRVLIDGVHVETGIGSPGCQWSQAIAADTAYISFRHVQQTETDPTVDNNRCSLG
jgi:catechol 2,3-dioxygenase-like lactoylglutathione lyase family enzyme